MMVLIQEQVGGYGESTHPEMSWWKGNDGGTHPWMSWWVWWKYSPRNGLVDVVEVLTYE